MQYNNINELKQKLKEYNEKERLISKERLPILIKLEKLLEEEQKNVHI